MHTQDRDRADEGIAQNVADENRPASESFGARRVDIVCFHHLDHAAAQGADDESSGADSDDKRRQEEVMQPVKKADAIARDRKQWEDKSEQQDKQYTEPESR